MSTAGSTARTSIAADLARERRGLMPMYIELTKARLSTLVVLTTAVGFVLASTAGLNWWLFFWTVFGTSLSAGSAAALNQVFEAGRDRRMQRTRNRPIPAGEIGLAHGFTVGIAMGYLGVGILAVMVNLFTAVLALVTIVIYVAMYTPLKVRSTLNTLVGAVCGAIPPMIGWVAVTGSLDLGAWVLGALLFIWQLPHFLALAWMYREDYARGGFVMLPRVDPDGRLTARVIVLSSLILIPLALTGVLAGLAGWMYALGSLLAGVWMSWLAFRFYVLRTDVAARKVFLASIVYLPILLALFTIDRNNAVAEPTVREATTTSAMVADARDRD